MCVLVCKKCEADIVLIVVLIWADVLLLEFKLSYSVYAIENKFKLKLM